MALHNIHKTVCVLLLYFGVFLISNGQTLVLSEFTANKNDTLIKYYRSSLPEITAKKVSFKSIKGERFQIYIKTDSLKTFAKNSDFNQEYGQYYIFDNQASIQISKNGKLLVNRIFTKETFRKLLNDKKFLSITILLRLNFVKYQPKNNLFKFETDIGMTDSDFVEAIEFHLNLKGKIVHWRIIPNKYF